MFFVLEGNWRVQTERRGAVWSLEPEMDEIYAEVLLPLLFRSRVSDPEPGLSVRGRGQPC